MTALTLEQSRRIHQHCEHFELAWPGPPRPRVESYLADATGLEREVLLSELLALELELRTAAGDSFTADEYRSRFPVLHDREVIVRVFRHLSVSVGPAGQTISIATEKAKPSGTPAIPTIEGYEILDVLGRGGMGVVYKARDVRLKRLVALKMILAGEHAGPQLLARFRTEAELVARLQHPNIVQIFDVGEQDGRPFIAFEFIDGKTLADVINREPQPGRNAAELLEAMAIAAHYAHCQGIVHRDLKPANILLATPVAVTPSGISGDTRDWREPSSSHGSALSGQRTTSTGLVPKITDFGLAKDLVNSPDHSSTGAILGTPNYMSPEQAQGRVREIGPASDIYSLGAILYMLLTGRPPFQGTTPIETVTMVVNDEPIAPTQLQPKLPRDLETICLKCLQKDPARRYASAGELADDLRRFLNDETILARPSGFFEKTWRLCRRNPMVAGLTVAIFAVLIAGVAVSVNYAVIARQEATTARTEKTRAETIARRARERAYIADVRQIQSAWEENNLGTVYELLNAQRPEQTDGDDLRGFEWHYWHRTAHVSTIISQHTGGVKAVSVSPNGRHVASGGRDAVIRLWKRGQEKEQLVLHGHVGDVNSLRFSPNGELLAGAGEDRTVRIWDVRSGQESYRFTGHTGPVTSACFTPDGQWIVSGSHDKTVKVWNISSGVVKITHVHPSEVLAVQVSPDGRWIASGCMDFNARVWSVESGRETQTLIGHLQEVRSVAFSPDGTKIATGSQDLTAKIWDATTGAVLHTLKGHRWDLFSVAFSPDGRRLVTDNFDKSIKIWNIETGQEEQTFKGHTFKVVSVCFHPDGRHLVSGSGDGTVRYWEVPPSPDPRVELQHTARMSFLACSPDGRWLVSAGGFIDRNDKRLPYGELFLRDRQNGLAPRALPGHTTGVACVAFTPDSRILVSAGSHWNEAKQEESDGGDVRLWDPVRGQHLKSLTGHAGRVLSMAVSPDSQWLATGGMTGDILVRRLPDGNDSYTLPGLTREITAMAFSPDGRFLAVGSFDSKVKIWDVTRRTEIATLTPSSRVSGLAFSPDSEQLAVADYNIDVTLYHTNNWTQDKLLRGHSGGVTSVTYSPDGKRIATGSEDMSAKIWDRASGQELLSLRGHTMLIRTVRFSADGHTLYTGSWDRTVRIWDATPKVP